MLEKLFKLKKNNTSIKTELLAGLTTFLTMSYIIFLQPAILEKDFLGNLTGLDFGAVLLATCLISGLTTIFMGIYANYPIALAPGMGENFFFISVIVSLNSLGFTNSWQVALAIVFISGILFLIISILKIREVIINSVSKSMRNGIAVGIGLFITFIGLKNGNIIIAKPGTLIGLNNNFLNADIGIFVAGLILTSILRVRNVRGDIFIGIIFSTILALISNKINYCGIIGLPEIKQNLFLQIDLKSALSLTCLPFIIVFLFMDLFDTLGTLMGVSETAGFIKNDELPRANKVLLVDSIGTVAGSLAGTSTVTSYIESITGVIAGGKTGLTSVATGILFLCAIIFSPIISIIAKYPPITAPALVIVGTMMMKNVQKIDWDDYSESIPAFLTLIGIPLFFSIADGLAIGFITYPILKFFSGKKEKISTIMYLMAFILLLYFILIRSKIL